MKKSEKIRLCFENCDVATLPSESISLLEFNGIDALHNELPSGMNKPDLKIRFKIKYEYMAYFDGTEVDKKFYSYLFEATRFNLVSVDLISEDGSANEIYLPWEDGDDDYTNLLETLTRLPDGQIMIEIKKE